MSLRGRLTVITTAVVLLATRWLVLAVAAGVTMAAGLAFALNLV